MAYYLIADDGSHPNRHYSLLPYNEVMVPELGAFVVFCKTCFKSPHVLAFFYFHAFVLNQ